MTGTFAFQARQARGVVPAQTMGPAPRVRAAAEARGQLAALRRPSAVPCIARQAAAPGDRPVAPILIPSDPRITKILGPVAEGHDQAVDPACQAPIAASPPWMPAQRRHSPLGLGEGTRRAPKLKAPDGPSGAQCRGACGEDCPRTCRLVGTYTERYEIGGCGYLIEFPNALECGTHAGCREHDACFDAAVANGETDMGGPRHALCNQVTFGKHPISAKDWARGLGPYDAWWYFVDDPIVRKSWRLAKPAGTTPPPAP